MKVVVVKILLICCRNNQVLTSARTYYLAADTVDERDQWIRGLDANLNRFKFLLFGETRIEIEKSSYKCY